MPLQLANLDAQYKVFLLFSLFLFSSEYLPTGDGFQTETEEKVDTDVDRGMILKRKLEREIMRSEERRWAQITQTLNLLRASVAQSGSESRSL